MDAGRAPPWCCRPTSPTETSVEALFAAVVAGASAGSTCCSTTPAAAPAAVPLEDLTLEQWRRVVDVNLTGAFLCTQAAFRADEGADAARRADHQQRLDLGACAAAATRRPTPPPSTPITGPDQIDRRSTAARTTSPAARSTSATPPRDMTARMTEGVPQADGTHRRRADDGRRARRPRRWCYMASLPLDANVLFMTVMATKMPFIGRG